MALSMVLVLAMVLVLGGCGSEGEDALIGTVSQASELCDPNSLDRPTISGCTITWGDSGWWQVQYQDSPWSTLCDTSSGSSCVVAPNTYKAINFSARPACVHRDLVVPTGCEGGGGDAGCGNSTCDTGETCASCAEDCGSCLPTGGTNLPSGGTNLISDGGFETGLAGFTPWGSGFARTTESKHSGSYGVRILEGSGGSRWVTGLRPHTSYTFKLMGRYTAGKMKIKWADSGWGALSQTATTSFPSEAFAEVSVTATAPANAALAELKIYSGGGTVYIDEVFFGESGAGGEPVCENGTCEDGETCSSCSQDCGPCGGGSSGGDSSFSFLVLGDTQGSSWDDAPARVMENYVDMANKNFVAGAMAVFHTGDIIVGNGDPDDTDHSGWAADIEDQWAYHRSAALLGGIDMLSSSWNETLFFGAIGNHDQTDDYFSQWNAVFGARNNPDVNIGRNSSDGVWYSVTRNDALFVMLDSGENWSSGWPYDAQTTWLRGVLSNSSAKWKFVFMHQPVYPCTTRHLGNKHALPWVEEFEAYGVDMVFNGHNHNYERTHPIKDNVKTTIAGGGVVYVTTGGGGAWPATATGFPTWSQTADVGHYSCDDDSEHGRQGILDKQKYGWPHYCRVEVINDNKLVHKCYGKATSDGPAVANTLGDEYTLNK